MHPDIRISDTSVDLDSSVNPDFISNFLYMQVRPLGDHILVRPKKKEETTSFGLVIPDTVDEKKKAEGEVVAVGPGKLLENGSRSQMEIKVGDYVIYKSWGGDEVKMGDEEMKILSQDDILAVVEK